MSRTKSKRPPRRGAGRPRGSATGDVRQVSVQPSRCPVCGSTRRQGYGNTVVQDYEGTAPDGQPFNRIVRRRTKCADCGQIRVERSLEYHPKI